MRLIFITIASYILLLGVYANSRNKFDGRSLGNSQSVRKNDIGPIEVSDDDADQTLGISNNSNLSEVSSAPTIVPSVIPTVVVIENASNIYLYPNAIILSDADGVLKLLTKDNSNMVTDWYKDAIKNDAMNVTSFVTTQANGNILNKLVAANSTKEVSIRVSKDSSSDEIVIDIVVN